MTARAVSLGFEIQADAIEVASLRKIAWRLMPVLTAAYILICLDRGDTAFADPRMNQQIRLTAEQFGFGTSILWIAYAAFAIPSNLLLYRFGARRWLAATMATWGMVAAGGALIGGPRSFYLLRTLLGAAEAGFFPGAVFLLSACFPPRYRTRMLAVLLLAEPLSAMMGGPLRRALLTLEGFGGLPSWRWMFIAEGLAAVLLGVAMQRMLTDRPATARWLRPEERIAVEDLIASEARYHEVTRLRTALTDPRVLLLAMIAFGFTAGSYGVALWLPRIVHLVLGNDRAVGFVSAIPFGLSAVAMLVSADRAGRGGRLASYLVLACLLAAGGLLLAVVFPSGWLSFLWLTVALIGITTARAIFWSIPPRFLTGAAAAGGLAMIDAIGALGGFAGPAMVGWLIQDTGWFAAGLAGMAGLLLLSPMLAAGLRSFVRQG